MSVGYFPYPSPYSPNQTDAARNMDPSSRDAPPLPIAPSGPLAGNDGANDYGNVKSSLAGLGESDRLLQKLPTEIWNGKIPGSGLRFPENLPDDRPILEIRCLDDRPRLGLGKFVIYLPCPASIANSNSANYSNTSVGNMGAAFGATLSGIGDGLGGDALTSGIAEDSARFLNNIAKQVTNPLTTAVAAIDKIPGADDGLKAAARIGSRATENKNVVTEFTSNFSRKYEFSYKFIPNSANESRIINTIVKVMQISVYAELEGFLLRTPPRFHIRILRSMKDAGSSSEAFTETPLLNMFQCYLDKCDITYGSSDSSSLQFFKDGSPLETNINFSFTEGRVLTANDIIRLQNNERL